MEKIIITKEKCERCQFIENSLNCVNCDKSRITTTIDQTNNRIREEWREKLNKILWDNIDSDVINCERPMKKQLAPDLEQFIDELLKSQEHKLREEMIEGLKTEEVECIDSFIRDVCSVVPKSKSEVRRRLDKILSSNTERVKKEIVEEERKYWINIFDNPPKRNKPYPCDNCTQNICRIEINRLDSIINNIK